MVSNQPMNIHAKVGATLVPMAVPMSCRKCWLLKIKTLKRRTNERSVIRNVVGSWGWGLSWGLSKASWNFSIPSFSGIFEYKAVTSAVTGVHCAGWGPFLFSAKGEQRGNMNV